MTLKVGPDIKVGEEIEYNGSTYTVVNIGTLKAMILNNLDVTKVITSRITDMSRLMFALGNQSYSDAFNQDISSWDVSNVTSMFEAFRGIEYLNVDISKWAVSYTHLRAHETDS